MEDNICPKTGKVCLNDRNFIITEIMSDTAKSSTARCCRECAASYIEDRNKNAKAIPPLMPSAIDFINSFFTDFMGLNIEAMPLQQIPIEVFKKKKQDAECPGCGSTIHDILGSGKIGCPKCYSFFHQEFGTLVSGAQNGPTKHKGKVPKSQEEMTVEKIQMDIEYSEYVLAQSIEQENYEDAAKIRDKIKRLKEQLRERLVD